MSKIKKLNHQGWSTNFSQKFNQTISNFEDTTRNCRKHYSNLCDIQRAECMFKSFQFCVIQKRAWSRTQTALQNGKLIQLALKVSPRERNSSVRRLISEFQKFQSVTLATAVTLTPADHFFVQFKLVKYENWFKRASFLTTSASKMFQ